MKFVVDYIKLIGKTYLETKVKFKQVILRNRLLLSLSLLVVGKIQTKSAMAANGAAPPTHVDTAHRIRPATHSCAIYTFYTSSTPLPFHIRLSRLWPHPIKLQESVLVLWQDSCHSWKCMFFNILGNGIASLEMMARAGLDMYNAYITCSPRSVWIEAWTVLTGHIQPWCHWAKKAFVKGSLIYGSIAKWF